mgnify:CR=1 FL=1
MRVDVDEVRKLRVLGEVREVDAPLFVLLLFFEELGLLGRPGTEETRGSH